MARVLEHFPVTGLENVERQKCVRKKQGPRKRHNRNLVWQWDGLIHWFLGYAADHPELLQESYFRRWYAATKRALALIQA